MNQTQPGMNDKDIERKISCKWWVGLEETTNGRAKLVGVYY